MALSEREARATVFAAPIFTPLTSTVCESSLCSSSPRASSVPNSPSEPLTTVACARARAGVSAPDVAARTAAARSMERAMSAARILRASVANARLLAGWMAS